MSAGLRGGKKHREIVGKNKPKQDRTQHISPFHSSHVLSVFFSHLSLSKDTWDLLGVPLSLAFTNLSDGHGGSHLSGSQSVDRIPPFPLPQERSGLEGEAQGTEDVFTLKTPL